MKLADRHSSDLNKTTPPLSKAKVKEYFLQLDKQWKLVRGKKIKRVFEFGEFMDGVEFVNKVAEISEEENHHPDIYLFYKKVVIELSTHAIGGLSGNDFILAAKIDRLKY
ncbi:4a-hydroxytetrahydrobiopterin dehydratase [Patescibacteria group bacterium]|nr:4a-hydroxytetrahydrobiopterin dehydratase [Patescibacteria group bacterium]